MTTALAVIATLALLLALSATLLYDRLVRLRNRSGNAWTSGSPALP